MRLAFSGLMDALARGATVVTPTPFHASVAIEQFNRAQLSAGVESWERPAIYSQDAWLTLSWQKARLASPELPSLLSLSQERELWRQIISSDRPDLFDLRAMAGLAQRAARVLAEYEIPITGEAWAEHADAQRFLKWHRLMQQRLKEERWITRSALWLQEAHADRNVLRWKPGRVATVRGKGLAYENTAEELEQTARAVRHLLESEGARSVGILVADLPSQAADLARIFDEVFFPGARPDIGLVHVQVGTQLRHPVISGAMLLLELMQDRIHHASAGAILRCPFMDGAAKERSSRALADQKLRKVRELDFSLNEIERAASACPILQKALRRVRTGTLKIRQLMRLTDWSAAFSDVLEAVKWPSLENISEGEQRAVDQWNRALSELASLGLVSPLVSLHEALGHLEAILRRPSESGDWSSPVQVLDAAESEGVEFEHSFLLNMTEENWAPRASLSPLIPYKLQRAFHVPGSDSESALQERTGKTDALFASAPNVYVSYAGNVAPLIRSRIDGGALEQWDGTIAAQSYQPAELETREDRQAPVLVQSGELRGGSGIIKAQSLCPFKAFAEYRLSARGEEDACFGFDALERGNCLHKALERVWKRLSSQANLKATPSSELREMVQDCVAEAVEDDGTGPIRTLTSEAERQRLTAVILDWLALEMARPQPFRVEQVEEALEVSLAGLELKLRVDRMDRLNDGSVVLIDYKSGGQTRNKLIGERPAEPQLLVYAAVSSEPVRGVYFAELKNRKPRAVGHGAAKHFSDSRGIQNHGNNWDDFLEGAKGNVESLAIEFQQGDAPVSPQKSACKYCKIKPICRINATGVDEEDDE